MGKPRAKQGAKTKAEALYRDGRVHFAVPADYGEGKALEQRLLAFMDRARAEATLAALDAVT